MIGPSTREKLGDIVTVDERPGLKLKGVSELVTGYVVIDIEPPEENQ